MRPVLRWWCLVWGVAAAAYIGIWIMAELVKMVVNYD